MRTPKTQAYHVQTPQGTTVIEATRMSVSEEGALAAWRETQDEDRLVIIAGDPIAMWAPGQWRAFWQEGVVTYTAGGAGVRTNIKLSEGSQPG